MGSENEVGFWYFTRDSGGAVDEDENHAAEGPGDAQKTNAAAVAG